MPDQHERLINGWHLDKRVPLALIAAIVIQTVGAVFWAGGMAQRVHSIEEAVREQRDLRERVARVEAQNESIQSGIERIEQKLDGGR